MKNSDMPAMPQACTDMGYPCNWGNGESQVPMGLTKREMFAMHAMQGILSGEMMKIMHSISKSKNKNHDEILAIMATELADALLKELEK